MKAIIFFFALLLSATFFMYRQVKSEGGAQPDPSVPLNEVHTLIHDYNEDKDAYIRNLLQDGFVNFTRDSMDESAQVMYRLRFQDAEMFVLHSYPKAHHRPTETWEYFVTRWDGRPVIISTYSNQRENMLSPATYRAIQSFCKTTTYDTTHTR